MCPLKEAAQDAPKQMAILSKNQSLTFEELSHLVDKTPLTFLSQEKSPLLLILQFFAALRHQSSFFPIHPSIPQIPLIENPPHQSLLLFTSGTTSTPKIAILSFKALLTNAQSTLSFLDLKPQDLWRLTLPLYHVGGIAILLRCLLARATLVLDDHPHITHLSLIPTHLYRATPIYKRIKCILLGGAPISSYPQYLPIHPTYGLTEMSSMVTLDGKLLPKRELQLSEEGEILVKGDTLFQGYLHEAPHQGWFHTRDLGSYRQGTLEIIGRKDWMFISGGENIQPEEIEKELLTLKGVYEAVVVAVDDPEFGKKAVAVVRAETGFDLTQMQKGLSSKLPKFKIPKILFLIDQMPLKNHFKLDRFILLQMVKKQLDQNSSGQKKSTYL